MRGWWLTSGPDGHAGYVSTQSRRTETTPVSFEDLDAEHGPLRPVEPMDDEDRTRIADTLRQLGTKAVATLAAALGAVWEDALGLYPPQERQKAQMALIAGRPSSWEADALLEVTFLGRDLLYNGGRRIDTGALKTLREVLAAAVDDHGPHHELAETLAGIVSAVADERDDGWASVADQWLRPGSLAKADTATVYRLLYSRSPRFEPDLV